MTEAIVDGSGTEAPATLGRLMASEAAAVAEFTPEAPREVEAVLAAEVEALHVLPTDRLVEAEASLRVLLDERDDVDPAAVETLRAVVPEAHLVED